MLYLLLETGSISYAMEVGVIVEVIPLIKISKTPGAPPYMAGLINYRGEIVPVIDLCALIDGVPCNKWMSSRIIVISYTFRELPAKRLGIMAQRVTDTVRCDTIEEIGDELEIPQTSANCISGIPSSTPFAERREFNQNAIYAGLQHGGNRLFDSAKVLNGGIVQRFDINRIIPEHLVAPLFE